jgi:putative flippase GtrA
MSGIIALGRQFVKFSAVGALAMVGHYAVLVVAVEAGGARALYASIAGSLVGAIISYALNYRFTFESNQSHPETLSRFLTVATVAFFLNGGIMAVLTGPIPIHYLAAQVVSTGVIVLWTFSVNRWWTFRPGGRS